MMSEPFALINEPGIWPKIARHARNCFDDAACHIQDLPKDGKYAMVHVASKEETMCEEKPSTMQWSLILNEKSPVLQSFPKHLIQRYVEMNGERHVAAFIHLKGANRAEYWGVVMFRKRLKSFK